MSLSQLARSISESPTLKLNETAALLREKGEPVIHLGGGEPKSKAPIDAIINCTSLLNTGEVRYTAPDGIPALKKAVIRYTEEHYHKLVSADNVVVSGGAKQALMVLLHATKAPGLRPTASEAFMPTSPTPIADPRPHNPTDTLPATAMSPSIGVNMCFLFVWLLSSSRGGPRSSCRNRFSDAPFRPPLRGGRSEPCRQS